MSSEPIVQDYAAIAKDAIEMARAEERVKAESRIAGTWTIDWKAIGVIIALVGNAFATGSWVSGINARQEQIEHAVAALKLETSAAASALKVRADAIDGGRVLDLQRLAAQEQVAKDVHESLAAIASKLDRLSERTPQRGG